MVDLSNKMMQLLLLVAIVHQSSCCWFSTENNRTTCNSFIEASAEGKDEWFNLFVFNHKMPLALKANSFLRMPNLLELSVCTLKSIELGAFNHLSKLDKLVIFDTKLEELPSELYKGLNIRNIQIFRNPNFKNLYPGYFKNLPQIRQVDIRENNVGHIRADIFNNTEIYKVYLDKNNIDTIDDNAFADMEGLVHISLTDNNLKTFESKRILGTTLTLKTAWLSKNKLTRLDKTVLEGMPTIEKLYFEVNEISFIEPGVFGIVPSLNYLDLSNNMLVEVNPQMFPSTGMQFLKYVFLHNNRYTFINKAIFYRIPKVTHITYGGNPLQCSCLDELKKVTEKRDVTSLCDSVYYSGERPTCILSSLNTNDCIYDVELTADMFELYNQALEGYPKLEQKCDTSKGLDNAILGAVP